MKRIEYSIEKNQDVIKRHGVSFEEIIKAVKKGKVLANIEHPNQKKYPGQMLLVVEITNYAYGVPYVEDEIKQFFKTLFPSRKLTRKYLQKGKRSTHEKETL